MPGLDHEVHELVKQPAGSKYGCNGKERRRDDVVVKDGFAVVGTARGGYLGYQKFKTVPGFGSLECRYDMSLTDSKCEGCQHRGSGEAYNEMVRREGT